MARVALLVIAACSSSPKPPAGDDGWKVQLLPDAAVDASETPPIETYVPPRRVAAGPAEKTRCLQLIGCGCDYGCQMGFWEADGWHVNYRDAGTIATIEQRCAGDDCRDVWIRDICQKTCPPPTTLATCVIVRGAVWSCEKQLR